jgi:NAD(P)-dependent dehydrogenase (short-subunit alcohol dehydrogenase family)
MTTPEASPRLLGGKTVLVTGGTRGIGLATALAFGRHGARSVLTYSWGSANDDEVRATFLAAGAPPPILVQADVSKPADTTALMTQLRELGVTIDVFVSNAAAALLVNDLEDYTERKLFQSLRGSAWPTFDYIKAIHASLGAYPRHVVVMSSDGPDRYTENYDFVAASKSVVETLCKYVQFRLRDQPVNINVLRSRAIRTESLDSTFGSEFYGFLRTFVREDWFMTVDEVANAAVAMCSGMFDGMRGQVVTLDRGSTFADGISYLYDNREESGL